MLMNTSKKFGLISKLLHWSLILTILLQVTFILMHEYIFHSGIWSGRFMLWHKSLGIVVFFIAMAFALWRIFSTKVAHTELPFYQQFLSKIVHNLLILCAILMPLSGYAMSMASGYGINWFGLSPVPNLIGKNPQLAHFAHSAHELLAWALCIVWLVHTLAALYHHFIRKDGILRNML